MTALKEAHVPDIGDFEGIPVIEILVAVGDTVAKDQGLVTLESDKATMEVPSPFAAVVREIKVKLGGGHAGHNDLRSIDQHCGPDFRRVRIGIGHPGHKDRVHYYVLGNYAKAEMDDLAHMLGAIGAEAEWLAKGDDARFMSDIALRMQD